MAAISVAEMTAIQAEGHELACDLPCTVKRQTTTPGTTGQPVENWSTIATTTAGMTQPGANLLANYSYLIGSLATWHVRLPIGTDVQTHDVLSVNSQDLEVQIVLTPQSYQAFVNVLASKVK